MCKPRRTPSRPCRSIDGLEEFLSQRMKAGQHPRFVSRREMNDVRVVAQLFVDLPIERALRPRWIAEDVRTLIPTQIELTPATTQNDVQCILVVPIHVRPIVMEALQELAGQVGFSPGGKIDEEEAGVEIRGLWFQAQLAKIRYWRGTANMAAATIEVCQSGPSIHKGSSTVLHRQANVPSKPLIPKPTKVGAKNHVGIKVDGSLDILQQPRHENSIINGVIDVVRAGYWQVGDFRGIDVNPLHLIPAVGPGLLDTRLARFAQAAIQHEKCAAFGRVLDCPVPTERSLPAALQSSRLPQAPRLGHDRNSWTLCSGMIARELATSSSLEGCRERLRSSNRHFLPFRGK